MNHAARLRAPFTRRYPRADITTTSETGGPRVLTQTSDGTHIAISTPTGPSTILAILARLTTSEGDEGDD